MVVPKNPKEAWSAHTPSKRKRPIGILAFESASTMSRLVSLHQSLSDPSLRLLRSDIMRSPAVSYLTSPDQHFLLRLLFSDVLSLLDSSAASLSRLSPPFSLTYARLKSSPSFSISSTKGIKRIEKSIASVAQLLEQMELLENMVKAKPPFSDPDLLKAQRKKIQRIKEESLWGKSFDRVVSLMSRLIIAIFARVCVVFGPFVPGLPPVIVSGGGGGGRFSFTPFNLRYCRIYPRMNASGPMELRSAVKEVALRNSCPIIGRGRETEHKMIRETVGMSGMAARYADVVLKAESYLRMRCGEEESEEGEEAAAREEIYGLLPVNLAGKVKGKLRGRWRERGGTGDDGEMAKGWKEAVDRILNWLAPVARDTLTWQEEKTLDRRRRLDTKQRVFAMQTLHFSDREKTEAAIVEVLVGISCMCWYDGRGRL